LSSQPGDQESAARSLLESIGSAARRTNQARVKQLGQALDSLRRGDLGPAERQRVAQVAHQLVGSAGTFGYANVSERARQLELFFAGGAVSDAVQVEAAGHAVAQMMQDLTEPAGETAELS